MPIGLSPCAGRSGFLIQHANLSRGCPLLDAATSSAEWRGQLRVTNGSRDQTGGASAFSPATDVIRIWDVLEEVGQQPIRRSRWTCHRSKQPPYSIITPAVQSTFCGRALQCRIRARLLLARIVST